jgi:hypothetical protein
MQEKNFAKSESKKGEVSEDGIAIQEGQIDTTTGEVENIIITTLSNHIAETQLQETQFKQEETLENPDIHHDQVVDEPVIDEPLPTEFAIIAGYIANSLNGIVYLGTYATTTNTLSQFPDSGVASLTVDFGYGSVALNLNDQIFYDDHGMGDGITGNTFEILPGETLSGDGRAVGTAYGPTGNIVKGTFDYSENTEEAIGTFQVQTGAF